MTYSLGVLRSIGLVMTIIGLAVTLVADSAHFVAVSSSVETDGDLLVSFKEAGLGGGTTVDYSLTGSAVATYGCYNNGGNNPHASKFKQDTGTVGVIGNATAAKNGRINGTLTAPPPDSTLTCNNGFTLKLASVAYDNLVLTDTTNGISTNPSSVSKNFPGGILVP